MSKLKEKSPGPKESATYQKMLEDVEGIVRSVGSGPMDLDEVVSQVEQGYKLIKTMRERLDTTKARVEKLRTEFEKDSEADSNSSKTSTGIEAADDNDDDDTPF